MSNLLRGHGGVPSRKEMVAMSERDKQKDWMGKTEHEKSHIDWNKLPLEMRIGCKKPKPKRR